jgi:hypothetical protein
LESRKPHHRVTVAPAIQSARTVTWGPSKRRQKFSVTVNIAVPVEAATERWGGAQTS